MQHYGTNQTLQQELAQAAKKVATPGFPVNKCVAAPSWITCNMPCLDGHAHVQHTTYHILTAFIELALICGVEHKVGLNDHPTAAAARKVERHTHELADCDGGTDRCVMHDTEGPQICMAHSTYRNTM